MNVDITFQPADIMGNSLIMPADEALLVEIFSEFQ
jgi:hypothetical protein